MVLLYRDIPTPNLPEGATHKLSANYYYTRDARREKVPPKVICSAVAQARIESGQPEAASEST